MMALSIAQLPLCTAHRHDDVGVALHHFANTVPEVPGGFHAAAERPLKLAGADPLFARAHEVDRL